MLRTKTVVCFMLLLTNVLVFGRTQPAPGKFGIAVEWLYMLPAYDQPYFGGSFEQQGTDIKLDRCPSDHHFNSGYRIELIDELCSCLDDIRFRWTHFPTFSETTSIEGPIFGNFPFPSFENFPDASIALKDTFRFYYLDFLLGWHVMDCCPFFLTLQGGIQYTSLRFEEQGEFLNPTMVQNQFVNVCSRFHGIGPEIGADVNFSFWNCFGLTSRSYVSLLVNKMESKSRIVAQTTGITETLNIKSKDYWHIVPFANIRAGLTYSRLFDMNCWGCLGCLNLDIEVGYEAMWLFNGMERIQPSFDSVEVTDVENIFDQLMTFNLSGPYVHAGITF